jgi:hypothetical protein
MIRPFSLALSSVVALALTCAALAAHAFTINADFEAGTLSEKANGSDGFSGAFEYRV